MSVPPAEAMALSALHGQLVSPFFVYLSQSAEVFSTPKYPPPPSKISITCPKVCVRQGSPPTHLYHRTYPESGVCSFPSSGTTVECALFALCALTPMALKEPTPGYNANETTVCICSVSRMHSHFQCTPGRNLVCRAHS